MNEQPTEAKIVFSPGIPWQHIIIEGDEEQRLPPVDGPAHPTVDKGPDNTPSEPTRDS